MISLVEGVVVIIDFINLDLRCDKLNRTLLLIYVSRWFYFVNRTWRKIITRIIEVVSEDIEMATFNVWVLCCGWLNEFRSHCRCWRIRVRWLRCLFVACGYYYINFLGPIKIRWIVACNLQIFFTYIRSPRYWFSWLSWFNLPLMLCIRNIKILLAFIHVYFMRLIPCMFQFHLFFEYVIKLLMSFLIISSTSSSML